MGIFDGRKLSEWARAGQAPLSAASSVELAARKERIRRRQTIVVVGSLVFSTLYVAAFWLNQMFCTPIELYHRTWATTAKYFYDRQVFQEKKWLALEHKYDAQIKNEADAEKYIAVILKTLDDPFTSFFNATDTARQGDAHDGFYSGVGMVMNSKTHPISVRRVMPGSPALSAGVKTGDLILSVDDIDCSHIEAVKIGEHTREHMYHPVRFLMQRAGKKLDMVMIPSKIPVVSTSCKILPDNIGYERIEGFVRNDLPKFVDRDFKKLKDCRALILDLRGNGGGGVDLCLDIASTMLESGTLVSLRSRTADGDYLTDKYILTKNDMTVEETREGRPKITTHRKRLDNVWGQKPMLVLVDDTSASAAEMVAAALSDNGRAALVGDRTYGKGIAQLYFRMPQATTLSVTAGRYFTPSGKWPGDGKELNDVQRQTPAGKLRGIMPRYEVKAVKDLEYGSVNDNQLQYAVNLLEGKMK
jgi:carboxyl-terminal processing protease